MGREGSRGESGSRWEGRGGEEEGRGAEKRGREKDERALPNSGHFFFRSNLEMREGEGGGGGRGNLHAFKPAC